MKRIKGAPKEVGIYFCYVQWDDESLMNEVVSVGRHWDGLKYFVKGEIINPDLITEYIYEDPLEFEV